MLKENLIHLFQNSIKQNWYAPALSNYGGTRLTFSEVAEHILKWHLIFQKCGLKQGDKIALIGQNSVNWALTYLTVVSYGGVIVPILADFSADDMDHLIAHSDSKMVFADTRILEALNPNRLQKMNAVFSLNDLQCVHTCKKSTLKNIEAAEEQFKEIHGASLKADHFMLPEVDNSQLSAIVYTSGTTGFSKGVMLPLRSLTVNAVYAMDHFDLKAGDTMLSILPLAHAFGCAFEFLFPFCLGVHTTFLNKTPTPRILLKALADIRPKLFLTVPLILEKIYKGKIKPLFDKKSMQLLWKLPKVNQLLQKKIRNQLFSVFGGNLMEIVVGGSALNKEVELFFNAIRFPVTVGYGMTEFGPLISYTGWQTQKPGSVGQKIEYVEIKIDSADPANIDGEILVRGENQMNGYYKNKEATRKVVDAEGWLHTGDMGIMDSDQFIYIHGRKKNMLLGPSGQNIYPEEIEAKLNNLPFVQESLVLDKEGRLIALVYPDYEAADSKGIQVEQLDELMEENRLNVNETLPKFSQISKIKLYPEEFEKTPTKKIKRFLYTM